jgi:hypothetical protein
MDAEMLRGTDKQEHARFPVDILSTPFPEGLFSSSPRNIVNKMVGLAYTMEYRVHRMHHSKRQPCCSVRVLSLSRWILGKDARGVDQPVAAGWLSGCEFNSRSSSRPPEIVWLINAKLFGGRLGAVPGKHGWCGPCQSAPRRHRRASWAPDHPCSDTDSLSSSSLAAQAAAKQGRGEAERREAPRVSLKGTKDWG